MKMKPVEYTQGCSDGACVLRIGPRPGQVTNGGCRCLRDVPTELRIKIMRKFAHERERLAAAEAALLDEKQEIRWYDTLITALEQQRDEAEALVTEARERDPDMYWLSRAWHRRAKNGGQDE